MAETNLDRAYKALVTIAAESHGEIFDVARNGNTISWVAVERLGANLPGALEMREDGMFHVVGCEGCGWWTLETALEYLSEV